ncbi:MAG: hypothetical protein HKO89_06825, partial [Saprospiraceae bacterium]|nr:hypothetical protein [Saprospiraceae bacterium]
MFIWSVVYDGLIGLEVGESVNSLTGCFRLSNPIVVQMESASGGFITVDGEVFIQICEDDLQNNILEVTQINQIGTNSNWVVTDAGGTIVSTPAGPSVNIDVLPAGTYSIFNVMYNTVLSGLVTGNHISDLTGSCFSLSNSITVVKDIAIAGTISTLLGDDIELCISGSIPPNIEINITGNAGAFSSLLVLDAAGNILDIVGSNSIIPNLAYDECYVRHLAYSASFTGLTIGQNISDFSGCHELSNAIRIGKAIVDGGLLTSGGATFLDRCVKEGDPLFVNLELSQESGDNMRYV